MCFSRGKIYKEKAQENRENLFINSRFCFLFVFMKCVVQLCYQTHFSLVEEGKESSEPPKQDILDIMKTLLCI